MPPELVKDGGSAEERTENRQNESLCLAPGEQMQNKNGASLVEVRLGWIWVLLVVVGGG